MRIWGIALKCVLSEITMASGPHINGSTALSSAAWAKIITQQDCQGDPRKLEVVSSLWQKVIDLSIEF